MNWLQKPIFQGMQDRLFEWAWATHRSPIGSLQDLSSFQSAQFETLTIHWPKTYQWPPAEKWMVSLVHGLRKFVAVQTKEIPQPYKGIVVAHVLVGKAKYEIAIDYSDYPSINEECVRHCGLYFKMQYSRDGYTSQHVLPGGFVPGGNQLYRFLPYIRALRDKRIFSFDVYGRFGLEFAHEVRQKAINILAEQSIFRFEGGGKKIRYSRFLREIAHSRICIDLPGNGDFCFRLVEYLAVGACVIRPRHNTILHAPLVDRKHIVYTKGDLSDLASLCAFYLRNDKPREEICRQSRAFFDQYLHRDQLAAYYLQSCLTYCVEGGNGSKPV
jgi:hypothetical protein